MCVNGIMAQGDYGGKDQCALPASMQVWKQGTRLGWETKAVKWRVVFQRCEISILEKGERQS